MKKILAGVVFLLVLSMAGMMAYVHFNPEKVFASAQNAERKAAHLELKSISVDNLDIAYLEGGTGDPLVLVHGFAADKDNWTRVAKFLTPHFRVIAPDLPGCGQSTKRMDLDYSLKGQAKWLHDFVTALGLSTINLGGNSMGGAIAGVYAATYGDQVKSLWLIDPAAVNFPEESDLQRMLKEGENPLIIKTPNDFNTLLNFVFYRRPYIPSSIVTMLGRHAVANKLMNEIVFKAIGNDPLRIDDLLKGSSIPTLVLWGDHDRVLNVSGAKVLCTKMADAKTVIMKDAGHAPMIERPRDAATSFLAFHGMKI